MLGSLLGVCVPGFWLSLNFIYLFAVRLGWLPAAGYASVFSEPVSALRYMVLPAVSLGFNQSALIARISRSCMLEALQQDYVRTARAKGLAERFVIYRHALRNAAIPVITVTGLSLGFMLSGAVIIETVFSWPGMGRLIVQAVPGRDFPVIQAGVFVFALIFVGLNLIVDLLYTVVDPRVRLT
jgi:peptide/nickel transport system permease protein